MGIFLGPSWDLNRDLKRYEKWWCFCRDLWWDDPLVVCLKTWLGNPRTFNGSCSWLSQRENPLIEDNTPCIEDNTPCIEDNTPLIEDHTPFIEDHTPYKWIIFARFDFQRADWLEVILDQPQLQSGDFADATALMIFKARASAEVLRLNSSLWIFMGYPLAIERNYWTSPCLMGKSTISTGPCSIANC